MAYNYGSVVDDTHFELQLKELSRSIANINSISSELDSLTNRGTAAGLAPSQQLAISRLEHSAILLVGNTKSNFSRLTQTSTVDRKGRIQLEQTKNEFQRVLAKFHRIQTELRQRLLQEAKSSRISDGHAAFPGYQSAVADNLTDWSTQQQTQNKIGNNLQNELSREAQMHMLEEDIVQVNVIFQQLSHVVYEQRANVDAIEANVESTYINQEAGTEQLFTAVRHRNTRRRRCCIFISALLAILLVIVLILAIYFSMQRGSSKIK